MALARLVVIEGPDVGSEFAIPMRGGGIGRGEDCVVQLTDLAVSRAHCLLELRGGRLALVDAGSRNRTLINGQEVAEHVLEDGDEISLGKTRLVFLPTEGGVAMLRQSMPSRVTMEVGSGELFRARAVGDAGDERARRLLAALARLGDELSVVGDRAALARAVCDAARDALGAERALLLVGDSPARLSPAGASTAAGAPTSLAVPQDVADRVLGGNLAIAVDEVPGGRTALAAPLAGAAGLLYADRDRAAAWDDVALMTLGCIAHLAGAALANLGARELLARENHELADQLGGSDFVGASAEAGAVLGFVAKVGPSDATVLITGESGCGKEMVARAIHKRSRRAHKAFIAVNCAALTESLIESELFGHEKGAFTGATDKKIGRFEAADQGTLFLDEVGELPLGCQTKFLRVLEEQSFERVGGTRSVEVDVRVLAATNRDLGEMVARGGFREDLFYRLSVIHTIVPPLRARPSDVPLLAEHFLARLKRQVARRIRGFAPDALRLLAGYAWPGNVRELRNAIERAIVLGDGDLIRATDLPPQVLGASGGVAAASAPLSGAASPAAPSAFVPAPVGPVAGARSLRELEREGIIAALAATAGNKAQAATILEIDRSTLYKKLKDYGIEG